MANALFRPLGHFAALRLASFRQGGTPTMLCDVSRLKATTLDGHSPFSKQIWSLGPLDAPQWTAPSRGTQTNILLPLTEQSAKQQRRRVKSLQLQQQRG